MSDFDGSLSAIMANLFRESGTKTAFVPCILASALIFSYTSADLVLNQTDLVEYVKTDTVSYTHLTLPTSDLV